MSGLPLPLIDAHCHPSAYSRDEWDRVVSAALLAGVKGCVAAGVWWDEFAALLATHRPQIAARVPDKTDFGLLFHTSSEFRLLACIGLHPMEIAHRWRSSSGQFERMLAERDAFEFTTVARKHRQFIWAIGETGFDASVECLDGWQSKELLLEAQDFGFQACLAVAEELGVPFVVHSRSAWGHTMKRLQAAKSERLGQFMVHCYSGPSSDLQLLARMGGFASFGGVLTWPNARRMREAFRAVDPEFYLLETDSPDLPPVLPEGTRIVRNEPKYLISVLERAAQMRGQSHVEIALAHSRNLTRFFFANQ